MKFNLLSGAVAKILQSVKSEGVGVCVCVLMEGDLNTYQSKWNTVHLHFVIKSNMFS